MTALLVFLFVVLPLLTVCAMFEDANDTHAGDVPYKRAPRFDGEKR